MKTVHHKDVIAYKNKSLGRHFSAPVLLCFFALVSGKHFFLEAAQVGLEESDSYFLERQKLSDSNRFITLSLGFTLENLKKSPDYFKDSFDDYKNRPDYYESQQQIISRILSVSYFLGPRGTMGYADETLNIQYIRYIEGSSRLLWMWGLSFPEHSSGFPLYFFVSGGAGSLYFGDVKNNLFGLADGSLGLGFRVSSSSLWGFNAKVYRQISINSSLKVYTYDAFDLGLTYYFN